MASDTPSSFALRPWPCGDRRPKNLGEFILRVNAERNGFRNVTEESLQKEIEAEASGVVESKEVDMIKSESEEEDDADQVGIQSIHKAVGEVRQQAEISHQNAMLALDFVSLLLTKEDAVRASMSLSPALRDLVGIGVLGADKLAKANISEARLQDQKLVSAGWKFADIDRTVESVLTSASRLQKEISVETKYWAEVLAVSDKGWTVTRVPNEPENLGVRYGFSEAAPDFRNSSLAPMRRGDDGTVELDCGTILGESQRLLVTIERNGMAVGRSALPTPLSQDAPLEDRVLEARNTIFAQELWHEMNREGRSLLAYGVRLEDSAMSFALDENSRIVFNLQPLERNTDEEASQPLPEDSRAESLNAALHQLLTYAHRVNNQRRSRPNTRNRNQATTMSPYPLLRPVLAHLQHEKDMQDATRFISDLTTILQSAGVSAAMFNLKEPPIAPNLAAARGSPSEALIMSLFGPLDCQFELIITPEARLLIHCRTVLTSIIGTSYQIHALPSAQGEPNPLQVVYPPSSSVDGYTLADMKFFLQQAVARVLVDRMSKTMLPVRIPSPPTPPEGEELPADWIRNISGVVLENANDDKERVSCDVLVPEAGNEGPQHPQLRVRGSWRAGSESKPAQGSWTWTVDDAVQGIRQETLEEVVRNVVNRTAQPSP